MIRNLSIRVILMALVAGLCLTLSPAAAPAQVSETQRMSRMSKAEAGAYYNKYACLSNKAYDRFVRVLWKGKRRVTVAEVRRRLPQFKQESRRHGRIEKTFYVKLRNPPAKWPKNVVKPVRKMSNRSETYAGFRLRQGRVSNARQWLRLNGRANHVRFGSLADTIRDRLDLPSSGQAC